MKLTLGFMLATVSVLLIDAQRYQPDECCQEYCYTTDEQPFLQFATKTAYELIYAKQSNQHRIQECTPIQFWSINRYGTRYPDLNTIQRLKQMIKLRDEIIRNYEERHSYPDRGRMCVSDFDLLKRWQWNEEINERTANNLTKQGVLDLTFLARRYSSKFDNLLRLPYSDRNYNFQYTDTDRTHHSYQAFIDGLFRDKSYMVRANIYDGHHFDNEKNCELNRYNPTTIPSIIDEYKRFKLKQDYQQMVRDVFRRLGFRYTLNDTLIENMYDLCRLEKAIDLDNRSAWCTVFNKEQLKLLEYAEDLKTYYRYGYGNPNSQKIGCSLVKDMYDRFEQAVNGDGNTQRVNVYFTHSSALLVLLTALGMANDYTPLSADNYYQQTRREWRTSKIYPFAANLATVLYECHHGERNRVMFFLNENPVNYPDCSVGLCNWSTIKQKLGTMVNECDLDYCEENGTNIMNPSILLWIIPIGLHLKYFL